VLVAEAGGKLTGEGQGLWCRVQGVVLVAEAGGKLTDWGNRVQGIG